MMQLIDFYLLILIFLIIYLSFLISDSLHPLSVTLNTDNLYPNKPDLLLCLTSVAKKGSNGGIPSSGTPNSKKNI